MSRLPPEDSAPDFPPGPGGPEDSAPGPRFVMTRDQLEAISTFVTMHVAVDFEIEDRGAAYFMVRLIDAEGERTAEQLIVPLY